MVEAKVNHDTQFYRIKGGVGVPLLPLLPPPPPSPITFETVDEILLGDLREKISRERSGQSVSLLHHLKQGLLPLEHLVEMFSPLTKSTPPPRGFSSLTFNRDKILKRNFD